MLRSDTGRVISSGALMAAVAVLQGAATVAALRYGTEAAMAVGRDLRNALFEHAQRLSTQEVDRIGVPSLVTRLSNDVQQIQTLLLALITLVFTAPVWPWAVSPWRCSRIPPSPGCWRRCSPCWWASWPC
ncbi:MULTISPECIES: ABC transporter transmembrane domain-containing protein [unclassified Streptomyces]|uniref:ABC transporter transmembrane domain-containing protein n=1 Tax=unclassified Streptomyces TaxID=2593676 RepID=UPI0036ECBE70